MSNKLIVKHNKIIEAKYTMTSTEAKLVAKLTSMIEKNDEDFKNHTFKVRDLLEELGLGRKNHNKLNQTIERMITREIRIFDKIDGDEIELLTTILSSCEYNNTQGTITLSYDPKLKPYFLQLKRNFTKYYIENVLELNSFYAIRLYELLKQYEKLKERTIEIKDLKKILGIEDKYEVYGNLKLRVIKPAIEEINDKTDLNVEFEEIKTGRKVTAIKFLVKKNEEIDDIIAEGGRVLNEADKVFGNIPQDPEMLHQFQQLYSMLPKNEKVNSNKKTLSRLLEEYEFENIEADIEYALKQPNIKNFMGFLVASCENGHYGLAEKEKAEKMKTKLSSKEIKDVQKFKTERKGW